MRAIVFGFALVAAGNVAGSKGCWTSEDLNPVRSALDSWRSAQNLVHVPLFAFGPSSGGWFAGQVGRTWQDVRAVAMQVMVPTLVDVQSPLPRGRAFPPLQVTLMQRDAGKLQEMSTLLAASWPGQEHARLLVAAPKAVTPLYFSEKIAGLSTQLSRSVHEALVAAGFVDAVTGLVRSHPSRGKWRETVLSALGQRRPLLPQGSIQLAMDSIFACLDTAYAYHASTCEYVNVTLDFFSTWCSSSSTSSSAFGMTGAGRGGRAWAHGHTTKPHDGPHL
jgi:hypothetical protein